MRKRLTNLETEDMPPIMAALIRVYGYTIMHDVKHLNLGRQKIRTFPRCLGDFQSIRVLTISHNLIERLPSRMIAWSLPQLQVLDVSYNLIWNIDEVKELGRLSRLETLNIAENPLPFCNNRMFILQALLLDNDVEPIAKEEPGNHSEDPAVTGPPQAYAPLQTSVGKKTSPKINRSRAITPDTLNTREIDRAQLVNTATKRSHARACLRSRIHAGPERAIARHRLKPEKGESMESSVVVVDQVHPRRPSTTPPVLTRGSSVLSSTPAPHNPTSPFPARPATAAPDLAITSSDPLNFSGVSCRRSKESRDARDPRVGAGAIHPGDVSAALLDQGDGEVEGASPLALIKCNQNIEDFLAPPITEAQKKEVIRDNNRSSGGKQLKALRLKTIMEYLIQSRRDAHRMKWAVGVVDKLSQFDPILFSQYVYLLPRPGPFPVLRILNEEEIHEVELEMMLDHASTTLHTNYDEPPSEHAMELNQAEYSRIRGEIKKQTGDRRKKRELKCPVIKKKKQEGEDEDTLSDELDKSPQKREVENGSDGSASEWSEDEDHMAQKMSNEEMLLYLLPTAQQNSLNPWEQDTKRKLQWLKVLKNRANEERLKSEEEAESELVFELLHASETYKDTKAELERVRMLGEETRVQIDLRTSKRHSGLQPVQEEEEISSAHAPSYDTFRQVEATRKVETDRRDAGVAFTDVLRRDFMHIKKRNNRLIGRPSKAYTSQEPWRIVDQLENEDIPVASKKMILQCNIDFSEGLTKVDSQALRQLIRDDQKVLGEEAHKRKINDHVNRLKEIKMWDKAGRRQLAKKAMKPVRFSSDVMEMCRQPPEETEEDTKEVSVPDDQPLTRSGMPLSKRRIIGNRIKPIDFEELTKKKTRSSMSWTELIKASEQIRQDLEKDMKALNQASIDFIKKELEYEDLRTDPSWVIYQYFKHKHKSSSRSRRAAVLASMRHNEEPATARSAGSSRRIGR
eukprot:Rmarinus@m.18121